MRSGESQGGVTPRQAPAQETPRPWMYRRRVCLSFLPCWSPIINRNCRTFRRLDGSVELAPDIGPYLIGGRPLARIYPYLYGPNAGCWSWFVQVVPQDAL